MVTATMPNTAEKSRAPTRAKVAKGKSRVKARSSGKKRAKATVPEGLTAQVYRQGREAISGAYDTAASAGSRVRRGMPKLGGNLHLRSRGQSLYATMEEHPYVIGAVGLGVGMVLAAFMPMTSSYRRKD
jgi:hypothetical protein